MPSLVFAVFFKPFVSVLSGCFYVSLNLVAGFSELNFAKFRETTPLTQRSSDSCHIWKLEKTTYACHESLSSSVVRAFDHCTEGHGFDSRRGLRFFLCPTRSRLVEYSIFS